MITRESKCPLCGGKMTYYHESHSDGESSPMSVMANDCNNINCRLPVRLWARVQVLVDTEISLATGVPFDGWKE